MLRFRNLTKSGNRFELVTKYTPSEDEILDQNLDTYACIVVFDFTRVSQCISVCKLCGDTGRFKLPPLVLIQQEITYMFQLFNSLSPYETSSPQKPQDQP